MADERDPQVSKRYRELGAEEPPRALDERILAASRQGLRKRSWYGPVAIAAVLTLAVAVTVQVEREKPDEFAAQAPAPAQAPARKEEAPPPKPAPRPVKPPQEAPPSPATSGFTPEPPQATAPQASADSVRELAKTNEAEAAGKGARSRESAAVGGVQTEQRAMRRDAPAPSASASAPRIHVDPERWLETIAELRRDGRHEDADKMLAEFRRQYPDYKLSDEMRAKVEKRE
jgi:hypothetical protein